VALNAAIDSGLFGGGENRGWKYTSVPFSSGAVKTVQTAKPNLRAYTFCHGIGFAEFLDESKFSPDHHVPAKLSYA